ncbi:hypothetical protein HanIR_Chr17g0872611 [Helianthus annuus]|nr:hypothetical protein HanIR_Chr17g0872611 [Helianthus annuus]
MHIKSLQMQVQMMQMGLGTTAPQGLYMPPWRHPSLQGPYIAPYFMMRPMDGVGYNMGHYGSYYNSVSPVFPPFGGGFHPPMPMGTGSPNLLPNPHLQCPSQTSEHVYSTTLSSDTIIVTGPQVGSGISSQSPYHMVPVTSHEDQ